MSTLAHWTRTMKALGIVLLATYFMAPTVVPIAGIRGEESPTSPAVGKLDSHRSPVALALAGNGRLLLTANQTAGSVSLIDAVEGKLLDELPTGDRPAGVAISTDGARGVVTHWYGYDLALLTISGDKLKLAGRLEVGPEPRGVALSPDGKTAYVAVGVANDVARVDLDSLKITGRLAVGREPRGLAISPDGGTLLVGNTRSRDVSVISTRDWKVERTIPIEGDNLRQIVISSDGKHGYIANMKNRRFATSANNIDLGWVLGQRLTRVELDGSAPYSTLSLDPRGEAAADAHGMAVSNDGKFLAVGLGGTHEVMIFRTDKRRLPWRIDGSRDLIPQELLNKDGRFRRVPLGGRPTEIAFARDGRTLYVANYLDDAVQVLDAETASLIRTIPLGGPVKPSLVRQGEILFHDARRSFNQWYSCNTCHPEGHTSGLDFDTKNDGYQDLSTAHVRSRKKVPTLRRVMRTGPWTWHGWQTDLNDAMVESFTKSMQGPKPRPDEIKAIVAYLDTLDYPRNPYLDHDGKLSPEAERGKAVYRSAKAACNTCHGSPELTDGKIHTVGLEESYDVFQGYNPPSLRGVYDKDPFLHDGRSPTLRDALSGPHSADAVTNLGDLSEQELSDLIEYLKTL